MTPDPILAVRAALEQCGYGPHGPERSFRSRCPGHGGENRDALSVTEGTDRRVLLWCHAHGCDAERIVTALGLSLCDLFPAGHRRGPRHRLEPAPRTDLAGGARTVADLLSALDRLAEPWTTMVAFTCPYCDSPAAWLRTRSGGTPHVDCPEGCSVPEITGALAARVTIARHEVARV